MENKELITLVQELMDKLKGQDQAVEYQKRELANVNALLGVKEYELNGAKKKIHALEQELADFRKSKQDTSNMWADYHAKVSGPLGSKGPTGSPGCFGSLSQEKTLHVNSLSTVGSSNGIITSGTINANAINHTPLIVDGYIKGFASNKALMKHLGIRDLSEELAEESTSKLGLYADLGIWDSLGSQVTSYERENFGSYKDFK